MFHSDTVTADVWDYRGDMSVKPALETTCILRQPVHKDHLYI